MIPNLSPPAAAAVWYQFGISWVSFWYQFLLVLLPLLLGRFAMQQQVALDTIADVEASGIWPGKVVTEVEPVGDFWEAEPEHQDYLERIPNGYTCHFPRADWVLSRRAAAE